MGNEPQDMLVDRILDQLEHLLPAQRPIPLHEPALELSRHPDPESAVRFAAKSTAQEARGLGLNLALAPVLDLDWKPEGADLIEVTFTQRHDGPPYDLDLEIEMSGGTSPARTETVTLTEQTQTYQLESPHRTTLVQLDPHHRVLRWTPEYGSRP